jgi:hypothetical protein
VTVTSVIPLKVASCVTGVKPLHPPDPFLLIFKITDGKPGSGGSCLQS